MVPRPGCPSGARLDTGQSANHLKKIDNDQRMRLERGTLKPIKGGDMRPSHLTAVSESGFYKLVARSDKPEAKAFQDWVTHEGRPRDADEGERMLPPNFIGGKKPSLPSDILRVGPWMTTRGV